MSCCNFSGVDNRGYNLDPETERITEAIYSDWTEAAGGGVRPYFPPLMDRRADDEFNPNPPITTTSGRATSPWRPTWGYDWKKGPTIGTGPTNPNPVPMGRMTQQPCEGGGDCPPGQSCVGGRCAITTRTRAGGPWELGGVGTWTSFDGGAVKQNWVPLVVLGLSLVVGIAISEYGFKQIVK